MYNLSVCIYLNHVSFDPRQNSFQFKSSVNCKFCQHPHRYDNFQIIMLKVIFKTSHLKSVSLGYFFLICGLNYFFVGRFFKGFFII